MMSHGGTAPVATNEGWTSNCVGGGTVHMSGFFYRLHPEDFRLRQELGEVAGAEVWDWPIGYADLAPYYDRIEALLGVSGQAGQYPTEPPRRSPYPLPPMTDHPAALHLDKVLGGLGWHPFQTPRAVLSRSRRCGEMETTSFSDTLTPSNLTGTGASGQAVWALRRRAAISALPNFTC